MYIFFTQKTCKPHAETQSSQSSTCFACAMSSGGAASFSYAASVLSAPLRELNVTMRETIS